MITQEVIVFICHSSHLNVDFTERVTVLCCIMLLTFLTAHTAHNFVDKNCDVCKAELVS